MRSHVAYTEQRYLYTEGGIDVFSDPYDVMCGDWVQGSTVYCEPCGRQLEREYPQGWRYYAGDTCKHGKYVGGCGADLMCGYCEIGE